MKNWEGIDKHRVEGKKYEDEAVMVEVMNNPFQTVFTRESEFRGHEWVEEHVDSLEEMQVTVQEMKKIIMEGLDVRKTSGTNGMSDWILKECSKQMAEKILYIIMSSLAEGKIPTDWKRTDIVPIYQRGCQEEPLNHRPVSLTSGC